MVDEMNVGIDTLLDVALGGPEIGPLNLSVLHAVLREVFSQMDVAGRKITIAKENADFCDSFNFIKAKLAEEEKRPRTAGGRPARVRSKVSVIVSDYALSSVGSGSQTGVGSTESGMEARAPLPAEAEERLAFVESQMKLLQDFPSVSELKSWAGQNKNPDTVVSDLWHFVSLSHRMNGCEEGMQKVTDLVDRFIPELKKLTDEQMKHKDELARHQGQLDDLYSQLKALSDRTSRISDKLDQTDNFTQQFYEDMQNEKVSTRKQFEKSAKKEDLNIFIPRHEIKSHDAKVEHDILKINESLATKAPLSRVDECAAKVDVKNLENWMKSLQSELENTPEKSEVVTWSKLESGFAGQLGGGGGRGSTTGRPSSSSSLTPRGDAPGGGVDGPSKGLVDNLARIGGVPDKQVELMDALDATRDRLDKKANKEELVKYATKESLEELLNRLKNLKGELDGFNAWRDRMDETSIPDIERSIEDLEKQVKETLKQFKKIRDDDKNTATQIENLLTYVDRLEENKASKQDVDRLARTLPSDDLVTIANHNNDVDLLNRKLRDLQDKLQLSEGELNKGLNEVSGTLEEKLDRDELRPLREYLENRFKQLAQPELPPDRHRQCFQSSHSPVQSRATSARSLPAMPAACCDHDAGTIVQPREDAAIFRQKMKFNCLSCNRPLTMQNSLSSSRGKQVTGQELDQMRQLQPMLKGENSGPPQRACGGTHTSATPGTSHPSREKLSARMIDARSPVMHDQAPIQSAPIASGEVDIEGIDGKLYKGMLKKSTRGQHYRARSAGASSPTRDRRPMSSKSAVDVPHRAATTFELHGESD